MEKKEKETKFKAGCEKTGPLYEKLMKIKTDENKVRRQIYNIKKEQYKNKPVPFGVRILLMTIAFFILPLTWVLNLIVSPIMLIVEFFTEKQYLEWFTFIKLCFTAKTYGDVSNRK